MSATDGEFGIKNLMDKATYERLEKDVAAVKNDISALTEQITDALNSFAGITFLEGHFVTPTIIGHRLALNALAVFIALAFWTWLWGPMGGFLSSPLLIVALILKDHLFPVASPNLPPG